MKFKMSLTLALLVTFGLAGPAFSSEEDESDRREAAGNKRQKMTSIHKRQKLMQPTGTEITPKTNQERRLPWLFDKHIHLKIMDSLSPIDALNLARVNWGFYQFSKTEAVINHFFFRSQGCAGLIGPDEYRSAVGYLTRISEALRLTGRDTRGFNPSFKIYSHFVAPVLGDLAVSEEGKNWYLNNFVHPLAQFSIIGRLVPSHAFLREQENPKAAVVAFINDSVNNNFNRYFRTSLLIRKRSLRRELSLGKKIRVNHVEFLCETVMKISLVQACFTENMDEEDRQDVMKACLTLTPENLVGRSEVIMANAEVLFANMGRRARASVILVCLRLLTPKQIAARSEAMSNNAKMLFTENIRGYHENVIYACLRLTPEKIYALPFHLFTENMNGYHRRGVMNACLKITPEQIVARSEAIVANADMLFTANMDGCYRARVIVVCLGLTPKQIAARSEAIVANAEMLFTENMDGYDRAGMIVVCLGLTPKQIAKQTN